MAVVVNRSKTLFEVDLFRLDTENVTLDNGIDTNVHILRHPGAAAIIPFIDIDMVLMIKQYRHAVGDYIWEIPAGTLDAKNEEPLECAKRELLEETGYASDCLTKIGRIMPSPGYSDEQLYLFMAKDLRPGRQNLEKDEVLSVHQLAFQQALEMVVSGEIYDAKTIAGLLLARQCLNGV